MVNLCPYDNRQFILEFLITYNMPSGTIKHCKCTEPESRQTVSFFLFIFFRWAGSNVQYTTKSWGGAWEWGYKTAAFYTEQHVHWLIAFSNIEVSQSGSNQLQKHGFICDAISSLVRMGTKQLLLKIAELETRSVCMELQARRVDLVVEQMPCQWQISIQPHTSTVHIFRIGLCTKRFYVVIPTLFPCILLICYPYISWYF